MCSNPSKCMDTWEGIWKLHSWNTKQQQIIIGSERKKGEASQHQHKKSTPSIAISINSILQMLSDQVRERKEDSSIGQEKAQRARAGGSIMQFPLFWLSLSPFWTNATSLGASNSVIVTQWICNNINLCNIWLSYCTFKWSLVHCVTNLWYLWPKNHGFSETMVNLGLQRV